MKKYIIVKDYRRISRLEYVDAKSDDLFEVMKEAEEMHTEEIYLIMILEKVGKTTYKDGFKITHYIDRLAHRSAWDLTSYECDVERRESQKYGFVFYN